MLFYVAVNREGHFYSYYGRFFSKMEATFFLS